MKLNKQPIRDFIRQYYSDQNLHDALCHARDGKLGYWSCCCLIGVVGAEHPLQAAVCFADYSSTPVDGHPRRRELRYESMGGDAEFAWLQSADDEAGRRRFLIPLLKAEMRRRAKLRNASMAAIPEPTSVPVAEHTEKVDLSFERYGLNQ